jgi:hypothetical protein
MTWALQHPCRRDSHRARGSLDNSLHGQHSWQRLRRGSAPQQRERGCGSSSAPLSAPQTLYRLKSTAQITRAGAGDDAAARFSPMERRRAESSEAVQRVVLAVGWRQSHMPLTSRPLFAHYFYIELDAEIANHQVNKGIADKMYLDGLEKVVTFGTAINEVNMRIGTSFIHPSTRHVSTSTERYRQGQPTKLPVPQRARLGTPCWASRSY